MNLVILSGFTDERDGDVGLGKLAASFRGTCVDSLGDLRVNGSLLRSSSENFFQIGSGGVYSHRYFNYGSA
jgi:hypothetical protein